MRKKMRLKQKQSGNVVFISDDDESFTLDEEFVNPNDKDLIFLQNKSRQNGGRRKKHQSQLSRIQLQQIYTTFLGDLSVTPKTINN